MKLNIGDGFFSEIDSSDFELVSKYSWRVLKSYKKSKFFYVATTSYELGKRRHIVMHRLLMGVLNKPGKQVDHINGNGLDNRRSNLRICSQSQNMMNRKKHTSSSKFKGVSWNKERKRWSSQIKLRGKQTHLGYFNCEKEAAEVYDNSANRMFGEYALTNKMLGLIL